MVNLKQNTNLELFKINLKKKNYFIIKNTNPIKNVSLVYFCKKLKNRFRKIFSDFFFMMKKMEIISGNLPFFKKLIIRVKNKKKIKKKLYVILKCKFFNNFENFLNFYLIHNAYNKINNYIKIKKKYNYLQELYKKNYLIKYCVTRDLISFNESFYFNSIIINKVKKSVNFFKKSVSKKNKKFILKVCINSRFNKFFNKLFYLELLNKYKIMFFLYKYFRNKIIKI